MYYGSDEMTNILIQILTGLANGQITCLYSPKTSLNGAKLLLNKGPAKKPTIESMASALLEPQIITPHALPMFRDGEDGRSGKRKREKERMDPRKSKRPELPVTGPGKGGRVGASATQHVVQNLFRDTTRDQDVRFSLLGRCSCAILFVSLCCARAEFLSLWLGGARNLFEHNIFAVL